jgi:hypothetical protein
MKRSEMITALKGEFWTSDVDAIADLADEIIDFLVSQGMQPPPVLYEGKFGPVFYNEWEPEDEKK